MATASKALSRLLSNNLHTSPAKCQQTGNTVFSVIALRNTFKVRSQLGDAARTVNRNSYEGRASVIGMDDWLPTGRFSENAIAVFDFFR